MGINSAHELRYRRQMSLTSFVLISVAIFLFQKVLALFLGCSCVSSVPRKFEQYG